MLQFMGPTVAPLAPFFQSYGVNLPSSLSTIISRLSTLIPAHLWRPKYGYNESLNKRGARPAKRDRAHRLKNKPYLSPRQTRAI